MKENMTRNHQIRILISLILVLCGCSATDQKPSFPYRAQVMYFSPTNESSSVDWAIGEQTLPTLQDPTTLIGSNFEIITGTKLTIDYSIGSLLSGKMSDSEVKNPIRYNVKNGVIVPSDTTTLLLFSAFRSMEMVIDKLEPATDLKIDTLKALIGGRYKMYFEPTLDIQDGQNITTISYKMNAAFNSEQNNFILFRRSNSEKIPIAANLKVISHEFGHALFKYSFFEQKEEKCEVIEESKIKERQADKFFPGRFAVEYGISGINEGYADFNSFVMTGETNPLEGTFTDINIENRSLVGSKFIYSNLGGDTICNGRFYCIGTLFARALYKASSSYQKNSAELMEFSRRVFAALRTTSAFLKQEPSLSLLPFPGKDQAKCERKTKIDLAYDGSVTSAFLAAFLRGFPSGKDRENLCEAFTDLFGTTGFAKEARSVCNP